MRCMKMIAAFALAIRKIAPNRLWPYIGIAELFYINSHIYIYIYIFIFIYIFISACISLYNICI